MNAEEFAEFTEDYDWVFQSRAMGKIVVVIAKSTHNDDVEINKKSMENGWAEAIHNKQSGGDVYIYVPMEWFTDD